MLLDCSELLLLKMLASRLIYLALPYLFIFAVAVGAALAFFCELLELSSLKDPVGEAIYSGGGEDNS